MRFQFENYVLDTDRRELRRGADLIPLAPRVFDLMEYLIRNRERVVSKDDLIAAVWNGRIVSESALTTRINGARRAIGDSGEKQRLIKTLPHKGLRFVGIVREDKLPPGEPAGSVPAEARPSLALPDKPSVAVLPFTNMSGDPEQEYFSDGITEDIITALSRLRWFFIIARTSTFAYKGQGVDVRQVGRDLGVRYILEGSVRKIGQRVRITAQLTDAVAGNHIWAERYDRELTDIFAVQDEITANVTAAIEPKLVAAEGVRCEARSIDDLDAWDLVARALSHFWKHTAGESRTAIAVLRQAVERYPKYAPAHSMLAYILTYSAHMGWIPAGPDRRLAAQLARRAVELDVDDPWAHQALGLLALTGREIEAAVLHFQAALTLNPNFVNAYRTLGWALNSGGRPEEALHCFDQAIRMNPRDPPGLLAFSIAGAHYLAGRYAESVKWAQRGLQTRPESLPGHRTLCASLAQAGRIEEAKAAMSRLRQLHPEISVAWCKRSVPYTAEPMAHFLDGLRKAGLPEE